MTIQIEPGQHVAVLGTTGAGKTYFTEHFLLPAYARKVVIDTKGGIDFPATKWPLLKREPKLAVRQIAAALRDEKHPAWQFAYRPPRPLRESVDIFALGCLAHAHGIALDFDEVTDYSNANFIGDGFMELVRKARAYRISVISGSQRAPGFNHWLLDNSLHRFVFYLKPTQRVLLRRTEPVLADAAEQLHFGQHDFIYEGPDGSMQYMSAQEE